MKNNFKTILLFLVFNFLISFSIEANEEFIFDVTEFLSQHLN